MRLAELIGVADFRLVEVELPRPRPGEVLVEVTACGVCASELEVWAGRAASAFPRRLGHEVSGIVAQVGEEATFEVGDRVGVWTPGAGYAEYVAAPATSCRPIGTVDPELGLLEPIACAVNAVEVADVRLGDDVAIVGAGFMGTLIQQLVHLRGARQVIVVDRRTDALRLATELGATRTVDGTRQSVPEAIADATGGRGVDITFEVTGVQAGLDVVGAVTRMSGKVVLVGFHQGEPRRIPLGQWNWMAFDLRNAHFREAATIMRGLDVGSRLLAAGKLELGRLVTHRFELGAISAAFQTAVDKPPGFVKAVVTMGAGAEPGDRRTRDAAVA